MPSSEMPEQPDFILSLIDVFRNSKTKTRVKRGPLGPFHPDPVPLFASILFDGCNLFGVGEIDLQSHIGAVRYEREDNRGYGGSERRTLPG